MCRLIWQEFCYTEREAISSIKMKEELAEGEHNSFHFKYLWHADIILGSELEKILVPTEAYST